MSRSSPKTKTPTSSSSTDHTDVNVHLTAADHEAASLAATLSHETLPEWIASLVNTALMP
jgi:hypothetical protein